MGRILPEKTGVERMNTRENTTTFEQMNEDTIQFYNRHGWVVIDQRLDEMTVNNARSSWITLRERCAQEMGVSMVSYRKSKPVARSLGAEGHFLTCSTNDQYEVLRKKVWIGPVLITPRPS